MACSCIHLASLLPSDIIAYQSPDAPCKRCNHPDENMLCLYCKDVFCGSFAKNHMLQHYQHNHSLALSSFRKFVQIVWCYHCDACASTNKLIQQFPAFSSIILQGEDWSSLSRLEKLDGMMVGASDLISKPFPNFNFHPLDAKSFVGQDEFGLAKEGLQKILYRGLEALADDQVQKEFLTYSSMLLSVDSCPSELKANLSSFRENFPEETATFVQARNELKVASDLSASINQKKFVLQQQTSRYTEAKKELSSEKKIADLKATIEKLEASLATEENKKVKIDEVLDSIETQVITAKDGLALDLAKVSAMEGKPQAANQLVDRRQSA